jgi:uncharacterized protein YhaN
LEDDNHDRRHLGDEPVIAYSVKDILTEMRADITNKLDRLFDLLALKADKGDLAALQQKVDAHDLHLAQIQGELDRAHNHVAWRSEWRRWLIPTILSVAMIAIMIASMFLTGGNTPAG